MKTTEQTFKHQLLLILALITLATPNLNATQEDNKVREQLIVYLHEDLEKVPVSEDKSLPYVKEITHVTMKKDNNSEMIMCQKVTIECKKGISVENVKSILGDGSKNLNFYYRRTDTAIKTTINLNHPIFSFKHKDFREKSDIKILTLFTTKEKKITATKITSDSDFGQDLDKLPFIYKVEDIPLTKKSTGKNKTVAEKKVTILFKKDKGITQEQLKKLLIGDENENEVKRGEKELKFYNEKGEEIKSNYHNNDALYTYKPTEYKTVDKEGSKSWITGPIIGGSLFFLFCIGLAYYYYRKEEQATPNTPEKENPVENTEEAKTSKKENPTESTEAIPAESHTTRNTILILLFLISIGLGLFFTYQKKK